MKRTDFKKGRRGFVVRTFGHIGCPLDIFIEEVKVIGIVDGCPAVWDVVNEESLFVSDLRDVFYNEKDARKQVVRYLSKQLKKFMKGGVE